MEKHCLICNKLFDDENGKNMICSICLAEKLIKAKYVKSELYFEKEYENSIRLCIKLNIFNIEKKFYFYTVDKETILAIKNAIQNNIQLFLKTKYFQVNGYKFFISNVEINDREIGRIYNNDRYIIENIVSLLIQFEKRKLKK